MLDPPVFDVPPVAAPPEPTAPSGVPPSSGPAVPPEPCFPPAPPPPLPVAPAPAPPSIVDFVPPPPLVPPLPLAPPLPARSPAAPPASPASGVGPPSCLVPVRPRPDVSKSEKLSVQATAAATAIAASRRRLHAFVPIRTVHSPGHFRDRTRRARRRPRGDCSARRASPQSRARRSPPPARRWPRSGTFCRRRRRPSGPESTASRDTLSRGSITSTTSSLRTPRT